VGKSRSIILLKMDLSHYLADSPPSVVPLAIKPHFEELGNEQKLYAHFLSLYVEFEFERTFETHIL